MHICRRSDEYNHGGYVMTDEITYHFGFSVWQCNCNDNQSPGQVRRRQKWEQRVGATLPVTFGRRWFRPPDGRLQLLRRRLLRNRNQVRAGAEVEYPSLASALPGSGNVHV